uniref:Uncharacterized protein n=1 Tax=viral metagenome TaxID=1070528 RepID=A0A6C0ITE9_9ZZZZ
MALFFHDIKDDIYTIPLPNSDLIFTRYLYIKDEVKVALLVSLLEKKEDAVFWAYELFMSGFKQETFIYLWQIYYDFYATLNPTFEDYFIKKHIEWVTDRCINDNIIGTLVNNLLVRPSNTDVYLLRNICDQFEIDIEYIDTNTNTNIINSYEMLVEHVCYWIEKEEYRSLAQTILFTKYKYNYTLLYTDCLAKVFNKNNKKNGLIRSFVSSLQVPINPRVILLAKLMELCTRLKGLQQSKSTYRIFDINEFNDINDINDINKDSVKPYNVLKQVYSKHSMQDVSNVGLFKLVRNKYSENNLKTAWLNNWEYHASFSPIWLDRIKRGGGYVNYTYKRIEFINDECAEVFYAEFGYEPDEQPKNIYDKAIGLLSSATASIMYNNKGLFIPFQEELDELEFV